MKSNNGRTYVENQYNKPGNGANKSGMLFRVDKKQFWGLAVSELVASNLLYTPVAVPDPPNPQLPQPALPCTKKLSRADLTEVPTSQILDDTPY